MSSSWRLFAYSMPRSNPFLGLHLVDNNDLHKAPRCGDTRAELRPLDGRAPLGFAPTCVDCLAIAEWEMNQWLNTLRAAPPSSD